MNLVINSQFRPFTYDEMVKPLVQYKEVYDQLEQDYSNLAAQTEMWRDAAIKGNNPIAYNMFNKYATDLEAITEDFSKGLNPSNRRALLGMKRRYASEIEPISKASKRRDALVEEQRKANLANPTMLWQRNASDISIDELIENPSADYGQQYSGALLTQQVSGAAANLAKEARDSKEGKERLRKILPYQYELIKQNGFSSDAVMKAILNSPDADTILTGIVERAIDSSGIRGWGDEATLQRAYDYARQGLYNAIGQTQSQVVTDQAGLESFRLASKAAYDRRAKEEAAKEYMKMYNARPRKLFSRTEVAEQNEKTRGQLEGFKNKSYFTDDGMLTTSAVKDLEEYMNLNPDSKSPYVQGRRDKLETFAKWAQDQGLRFIPTQSLGRDGSVATTYKVDPRSIPNINSYYQSTMNAISSGELATGIGNVEVYETPIRNKTDREFLAEVIETRLGGEEGTIYKAGKLNQDGTIAQGEGMKMKDFLEKLEEKPILNLINNPTGNQVGVELVGGEKFLLPMEVYDEISRGFISKANAAASMAGSTEEMFTNLNIASSYMGSLLNTAAGTEYKPNDATTSIPLRR